MKWTKGSEWHLASNPHGYTISKSHTANGLVYQAWHGKERVLIARGPEALAQCKAAAEAHRRGSR